MDEEKLANKYTGKNAHNYDSSRKSSRKWNNEQNAVELSLTNIMYDDGIHNILDIPVGTGRFFDIYDSLQPTPKVLGIDVSDDMLEKAKNKKKKGNHDSIQLRQGNILENLNLQVKIDVIVCIRLFNWFSLEQIKNALGNLKKQDPEYLLIGVRTMDIGKYDWKRKTMRFINRIPSFLRDYGGTNVHRLKKWRHLLEKNDLLVENRILVEERISGSKYGTDYYIYTLKCV